jgi:hypothetical protein
MWRRSSQGEQKCGAEYRHELLKLGGRAVRTEQQICEPPRTSSRLGASTKRQASTVSTNIGFFDEIARIVCPSVYGDLSGK